MEKIGNYSVHPLASKLPMMTSEEFVELKESIKTQGLMYPIITLDKEPVIIDGRNRLRACLELNINPKFITIGEFLNNNMELRADTMGTGDLTGLMEAEQSGDLDATIRELVLILNVVRRQLTDWQKYKQITNIKGKPKQGAPKGSKNAAKNKSAETALLISDTPTTKEIAEDLGVSERKAKQMNVIDDKATEEVKEKLAKDEISVNAAYQETVSQKKETKSKSKKADWFEENIEDEDERYIVREVVAVKARIEKKLGIVYFDEFIKMFNTIDHTNYKKTWKQA